MNDIENILIGVSDGNIIAFKQLYRLLYPEMKRFLHYFDISDFLMEDIISDVFMTLWIKRAHVKKIKNIRGYMFVCAKNQMLKYRKSLHLEDKISISDSGVKEKPDRFEDSIDYAIEKKEAAEIVRKYIKQLPEKCRMIYILIKYEKMTYSEVAQLLSISEKTVQAQMIIAVKKLGAAIKNKFDRDDI